MCLFNKQSLPGMWRAARIVATYARSDKPTWPPWCPGKKREKKTGLLPPRPRFVIIIASRVFSHAKQLDAVVSSEYATRKKLFSGTSFDARTVRWGDVRELLFHMTSCMETHAFYSYQTAACCDNCCYRGIIVIIVVAVKRDTVSRG